MGVRIRNPVAEGKLREVAQRLDMDVTAALIHLLDGKLAEIAAEKAAKRLRKAGPVSRKKKAAA
jgi:hypothetical protein